MICRLHLVDLLLGQVGDLFETGDAERLALGLAPALQPVRHFDFIAHAGRFVEVGAQQFLGEILLGKKVLLVHVRIDIALPMPQRDGIPVGILQVGGHAADALLLDALEGLEVGGGGIGFGRGGQVEGGFDDRINAFRQADEGKGLHGRGRHYDPHRVGQADILPGQDDQAAQDEARVFPGVQHFRQPVQGGVRVGAAHRFDEGADRVVMGIPILVVQHRPALDRFLGHLHGDMDHAVRIRGGGFHRQFEGVQGIAGIPAGHVDQVCAGIRVQHAPGACRSRVPCPPAPYPGSSRSARRSAAAVGRPGCARPARRSPRNRGSRWWRRSARTCRFRHAAAGHPAGPCSSDGPRPRTGWSSSGTGAGARGRHRSRP